MKRTDPKLKAAALWVSLLLGVFFWMLVASLVGTLAGWIMKSF